MSKYLMEIIKDTEAFKRALRNVKNCKTLQERAKKGQKGDFKGDGSLDALYSRLWKILKVFLTHHM